MFIKSLMRLSYSSQNWSYVYFRFFLVRIQPMKSEVSVFW